MNKITSSISRLLPLETRYKIYDLRERWWYAKQRREWAAEPQRQAQALRILFHPELPMSEHTIWKAAALLGHTMTRRTGGTFDVAVRFHRETVVTDDPAMDAIVASRPVINGTCLDISKSHVNEVFGEVFGYDVGVDPTTHVGVAVAKSEQNAVHDGREVQCPTQPEPGVSYQRLVDTRTADGTQVGLMRVCIVGEQIPLVFHKLRPISSKLSDAEDVATVHETSELLSDQEQVLLLSFCERMGIDTGELDVLRDNGDGRIYVVDANCEPWGPPDHFIDNGQDLEMIALLAPSYQVLFDRFAVGTAAT